MSDELDSIRVVREAQRTARHLVIEGEVWMVYELPPLQFDRRHAPSLVFETDITVRRVRNFPANWRDLDDNALFALSWSA
jgi:hypothetical protein